MVYFCRGLCPVDTCLLSAVVEEGSRLLPVITGLGSVSGRYFLKECSMVTMQKYIFMLLYNPYRQE